MIIRSLLKDAGKKINPADAELLLSSALGITKLLMIMEPEKQVSPDQESAFRELVARRLKHEPVAYLTGQKDFFGLTFQVAPGVLIPRPETETMVELALEHLRFCKRRHTVIDIGTGSGAIACALAANSGEKILATEFSPVAFKIARENIKRLGFANRIELLPGNGLAPALSKHAFKEAEELIILANLPYIPTRDWEKLMPDVKDFEPREALDGGADGLDLYRVLLNQLEDIKKPMRVIMEIDPSQTESLPKEIIKRFPDAEITTYKDLANLNRFIIFTK
ncbi:MAG: peptide chain release factor N(5)-glutamine methyltransferase [bacterium]